MNGNGTTAATTTIATVSAAVAAAAAIEQQQHQLHTPQRSASALRRGTQVQRSSMRLRQQQASLPAINFSIDWLLSVIDND